jgi:hypothetical protein
MLRGECPGATSDFFLVQVLADVRWNRDIHHVRVG